MRNFLIPPRPPRAGERLGLENDGGSSHGQDGRLKPSSSHARQQDGVAAEDLPRLPEGAGA